MLGRGLVRRCLAITAAALAVTGAGALPSVAAGCGGLLQPPCPPATDYTGASDPGGDVNAAIAVPPADGKQFGFNTNLWWQNSGGRDLVPFEVDRSARAGAHIIRTTVTWATFAKSPSSPLGEAQ